MSYFCVNITIVHFEIIVQFSNRVQNLALSLEYRYFAFSKYLHSERDAHFSEVIKKKSNTGFDSSSLINLS